jgi:hypothetical protein
MLTRFDPIDANCAECPDPCVFYKGGDIENAECAPLQIGIL